MIDRRLIIQIKDRLSHVPAVVLLGPRQVGKTTLARAIAQDRDALYLDLERQEDLTFSEGVVPRAKFAVYAGNERYPLGRGIEAIGLREMCQEVSHNFNQP